MSKIEEIRKDIEIILENGPLTGYEIYIELRSNLGEVKDKQFHEAMYNKLDDGSIDVIGYSKEFDNKGREKNKTKQKQSAKIDGIIFTKFSKLSQFEVHNQLVTIIYEPKLSEKSDEYKSIRNLFFKALKQIYNYEMSSYLVNLRRINKINLKALNNILNRMEKEEIEMSKDELDLFNLTSRNIKNLQNLLKDLENFENACIEIDKPLYSEEIFNENPEAVWNYPLELILKDLNLIFDSSYYIDKHGSYNKEEIAKRFGYNKPEDKSQNFDELFLKIIEYIKISPEEDKITLISIFTRCLTSSERNYHMFRDFLRNFEANYNGIYERYIKYFMGNNDTQFNSDIKSGKHSETLKTNDKQFNSKLKSWNHSKTLKK